MFKVWFERQFVAQLNWWNNLMWEKIFWWLVWLHVHYINIQTFLVTQLSCSRLYVCLLTTLLFWDTIRQLLEYCMCYTVNFPLMDTLISGQLDVRNYLTLFSFSLFSYYRSNSRKWTALVMVTFSVSAYERVDCTLYCLSRGRGENSAHSRN